MTTDLGKESEAEPPCKVARRLNETGVPAAIPHEVRVVMVDPRSKELGDSPVLRLVGDVWESVGRSQSPAWSPRRRPFQEAKVPGG